jgi:hypothetical protein
MLKKVIPSLMLVCISIFSMATTYYVSSTGNDSNSGITSDQPWQTLTKVNSRTFVAGDQILFQRGSTFYGSLTIKNSGTSGNPISFGAYGTGESPVITGFTTILAWTNLGSNIWESTSAISTLATLNMVSVNNVNTPMGRFPNADVTNSGYLTFQSHSGNTSITSSSLTGTPNWTGAEVVIRPNRWILNRAAISSNTGGTLVFSPATTYAPIDGFGFFIQNDARTLDSQNEWYYNPTTKKLRIFSTSQPVNVQVATVEDLIYVTGSYITIQDLTITGSNDEAITGNSITRTNVSIKGCTIRFVGSDAITGLRSTNFIVDGNTITDVNNNGIEADGDNAVIQNNTVSRVGLFPGMGSLIYMGISVGNTGSLVQNNSVTNVGYVGISFYGNSITVKNNYVDTFCKVIDDGGGIYTYTGSNPSMSNCLITGNIVLNGIGARDGSSGNMTSTAIGIYLDNNTKNVEVSYNTIANTDTYGMLMNNPSYINIHHNTFFNNSPQIRSSFFSGSNPVTNNVISSNIFTSNTALKGVVSLVSQEENLSNFGVIDNNYYWLLSDSQNLFTTSQPSATYQQRTFSEWKAYLGKDLSSYKSLITDINSLQFKFNETKTIKTITLSQPMVDVKGTKYVGTLTLQPYTSVVLMKDPKPAKYSTEIKSICDGFSYNGWTTTGKYERTLLAKSGADSIVTTYLTVNPKYAILEDVTINSGENYQGWTTSGTYVRNLNSISGCDSTITTHLTVNISTIKVGEITQTIELKKGNNMISTYLQATNPNIIAATQSIRDSGDLIKMQDESGNSYENWGILGGWINNVGSIQNTEGYKIIVANNCTLQITGQQIALPLNIPLNVGWNIISFPRADVLDAKMIIQSLIDQNVLVKVQDEIGNSIEDWGIYGGWKNGIGNFVPGKAYRVKVNSNSILTINENYPKSSVVPVYAQQTQHFVSVAEGNGSDQMNINLVGLNESGLSVGDELAAFDGTSCVGTLKITNQQLIDGSASLIASCSTSNLRKDGFNEGAPIQLKLWNQLSGEESGIQFSILRGSPSYLKNETILGKIKSLTTSISNFVEITKIEVYPNPCQGRFTVRFSDLPESGSRIDVLDLSGRKVASRLITSISEDFDLLGQASGLYLVKSILGLKESINKLILQ